jgi:hypothetical protein
MFVATLQMDRQVICANLPSAGWASNEEKLEDRRVENNGCREIRLSLLGAYQFLLKANRKLYGIS